MKGKFKLKVSIIGAGLSGLSCAFQLEKNGITPIIYEKNSKVGNAHPTPEAMLEVLYRPINDPYQYLANSYQLFLKPYQTVNSMVIHSSRHSTSLNGFQGFVNLRGDIDASLERQLLNKISSPVNYEHHLSYREIMEESDYVVIATGDIEYISNIQPWSKDVTVNLKLADIKGDFKSDQVVMWLDKEIAPKGYAYLLPWNEEKATIAIGIPEQNGVDIDSLFNQFVKKIEKELKFSLSNIYEFKDFVIGQPEKNQIGSTLFVGNAGGFLYPFLGFGQFTSILSGLKAADSILLNKDFNHEINEFRLDYQRSLAIRRLFEGLEQEQFDTLVKGLSNSVIKKLYLNDSLNFFKWFGEILTIGRK